MIEVKSFFVICPGDPSVGIFPGRFLVDGPFFFDSVNEIESFRIDLMNVFRDHVADDSYVLTSDEFLSDIH